MPVPDLDFRQILELSRDAVLVGDRAGRIVYANRAAESLLHWPPGELSGEPLTAIIPPALRGKHTAGFNRYRTTRSPRILGRTVRVPALRRDGVEIRVELTLAAHRGGAGAEWYVASLREPGAAPAARDVAPAAAAPSLRALRAVLDGLTGDLEDAELARRLDALLSAHFGTLLCRLYLRSEDGSLHLGEGVRPVAALGETAECAAGDPVRQAAETGRPVRAESLPYNPDWLAEHRIAAATALPLVAAGTVHGVLLCLAAEPFPEETVELLEFASAHLAGLLRERAHRQLQAQLEAERAARAGLAELVRELASPEPNGVLERLVELAVTLTGADEGSLVLLNPVTGEGEVRACAGYRTSILGLKIPPGQGLTAVVLEEGRTVEVLDYQAFPGAVPKIRQRGVRSAVGTPVRTRDGSVIGALKVESKQAGFRFSAAALEVLEDLAAVASLALQRSR